MAEPQNPEQREHNTRRTRAGTILAIIGSLAAITWLLNLTAGLIEIPDNLPLIGNIDEALAAAVLFSCLRYLGIDILPLFREPNPESDREQE